MGRQGKASSVRIALCISIDVCVLFVAFLSSYEGPRIEGIGRGGGI